MSPRDHLLIKVLPREQWKVPGIGPDQTAQYSSDNGMTLMEYKPGGVHRVPDYVAWNMEKRGWVKIITDDDLVTQDAVDTTIEMKDLRAKKE